MILNRILNWINFERNSNIELNQFGYRTWLHHHGCYLDCYVKGKSYVKAILSGDWNHWVVQLYLFRLTNFVQAAWSWAFEWSSANNGSVCFVNCKISIINPPCHLCRRNDDHSPHTLGGLTPYPQKGWPNKIFVLFLLFTWKNDFLVQ